MKKICVELPNKAFAFNSVARRVYTSNGRSCGAEKARARGAVISTSAARYAGNLGVSPSVRRFFRISRQTMICQLRPEIGYFSTKNYHLEVNF